VSSLWLPGAAGPLEQFVDRLHRQIAEFAERHSVSEVSVEVELIDGALLHVKEISPEPGFGFVTLCPYTDEGGEPEEHVIVPLGSVRRVALGRSEEKRARFGFTPSASK
jgi:hypothetical protein